MDAFHPKRPVFSITYRFSLSPCTNASLCGLLPAKSGLTERQTIFCLVSHSVSDELEFPVLQRPDRQFMGKQAVCFQIGGQHFHGQCDRSVLVRLTGRHFRLDHVITQKYIIIGFDLPPRVIVPFPAVLRQLPELVEVNVEIGQNYLLKFLRSIAP